MSRKPGPGWYFGAIMLGMLPAAVGILLLIPVFTAPVGFAFILLGGYPLYRVDKRRLMNKLADHPLDMNGVEKPWE